MKLSETARIVLQGAAQREDRLIPRRSAVPKVADVNVSRALVKQGLVEIIRAPANVSDVVIVGEGDCALAFLIADAGFRAINLNPPSSQADAAGILDPAAEAPVSPTNTVPARTTLRQAAAAVLAAWSVEADRGTAFPAGLEPLMAGLRSACESHQARASSGQPRKGTKQAAVLDLLRRNDGATVSQVMESTGWASHTVRGFFAGLKKKGITVVNVDRVRQTSSVERGAKGSYSIYRVADRGHG